MTGRLPVPIGGLTRVMGDRVSAVMSSTVSAFHRKQDSGKAMIDPRYEISRTSNPPES